MPVYIFFFLLYWFFNNAKFNVEFLLISFFKSFFQCFESAFDRRRSFCTYLYKFYDVPLYIYSCLYLWIIQAHELKMLVIWHQCIGDYISFWYIDGENRYCNVFMKCKMIAKWSHCILKWHFDLYCLVHHRELPRNSTKNN